MTPTQRAGLRKAHQVAAMATAEARRGADGPRSGIRATGRTGHKLVPPQGQAKQAGSSSGGRTGAARQDQGEVGPLPGDDGDISVPVARSRGGSDQGSAGSDHGKQATIQPLQDDGSSEERDDSAVVTTEPEQCHDSAMHRDSAEEAEAAATTRPVQEQEREQKQKQAALEALEARAAALRARYFGCPEHGEDEGGPHAHTSEAAARRGQGAGGGAPPPFAVGRPPTPQAAAPPPPGSMEAKLWRRTATSYLLDGQDPPASVDPVPYDRRPFSLEEQQRLRDVVVVAPFDTDREGIHPPSVPNRYGGQHAAGKRPSSRHPAERSRSPVQVNRRFPPKSKRAALSEYDARFASPSMLAARNPFLPRR